MGDSELAGGAAGMQPACLSEGGRERLERKAVPDGPLSRGWLSSCPSLPMTASSLKPKLWALYPHFWPWAHLPLVYLEGWAVHWDL